MQQQQHLYHSQTDGEVAEEREKKQKKPKYRMRIIHNMEAYYLEWSDIVHSETVSGGRDSARYHECDITQT